MIESKPGIAELGAVFEQASRLYGVCGDADAVGPDPAELIEGGNEARGARFFEPLPRFVRVTCYAVFVEQHAAQIVHGLRIGLLCGS